MLKAKVYKGKYAFRFCKHHTNEFMDKPISKQIQVCIEKALDLGKKSFIIFPFGDTGVKALGILREVYNISNELIIDNHLCKYNDQIKPLKKLEEIDTSESAVLFMYTNIKKYD